MDKDFNNEKCENTCSCGHDHMIGSRKELVELALEEIDETIELHRPYVDDIHIKCSECGNTMTRVTDVMDCWFDRIRKC